MRRWKYAFLGVAGLAVIVIISLAAIEFRQSGFSAGLGATIATASLSLMALANSALGSAATEDRSQFANAFAIARRWDESPIVKARDVIRPYLLSPAKLHTAAVEDGDVKRALIDFMNFFWDMAAAVELQWADPRYLYLRFSVTLDTLFPALEALDRSSPDKSTTTALKSIGVLRKRWATDPFASL
jgi:hypothetical protein